MFCKRGFIAATLLFSILTVQARDVFELESQRLDDGSFQYRLRTLPDPFFIGITCHQIAPVEFTNYVDITPPAHWTNAPGLSGITFDDSYVQPRINEITFLERSSATHFKKLQYGFIVIVYFEFAANFDGFNGAGGYLSLDCLVPCSAEESDGSLPTLTSRVELIKDIKIDALVRTNDEVHGVTFSWNQPSTVELEGSQDMQSWNYIARFFGNPPQSTWTTNVSLNSYGKFFRLAFVANSHITNARLAIPFAPFVKANNIPIQTCKIVQGRLAAEFASQPDATYQVDFCKTEGESVETLQLIATNRLTKVSFDIGKCPEGGYVRVRQLGN